MSVVHPRHAAFAVLAGIAVIAIAGCGKKAEESGVLAYVPADTAYVFANLEPIPVDVSNVMLGKTGPLLVEYERMLDRISTQPASPATDSTDTAEPNDEATDDIDAGSAAGDAKPATDLPSAALTAVRVSRELIRQIRQLDSVEKFTAVGFDPQGHYALYGVGIWPVIRSELSSADNFRAFVARIEQNTGSKLATGRIGTQDYWNIALPGAEFVMAIVGQHLVLTVFPTGADELSKQRLLGLVKPERSLAASGELSSLIKTEGYLPQGAGWIDLRRAFAQSASDPTLAQVLKASGGDKPAELSNECRAEIDGMLAKAPRMIMGYTTMSTRAIDSRGRVELDPALAAEMLALVPAPIAGGSRNPDALFDLYLSVPVLKVKDFALKQARAISAQPYRCESLKAINEGATKAVDQLSQMLPPPFSDITGVRITVDSVAFPAGEASGSLIPDVRGKLLVATENPSFLIGLAQMAVPTLAGVVFKPDGAPVEIPTQGLPMAEMLPPLHVAMVDKAVAVSFGHDAVAGLTGYIRAPAGAAGDWMLSTVSGDFYRVQADLMSRLQTMLPADDKNPFDVEASANINRLYADLFKHSAMDIRISAKGIEFDQQLELKP